ncbi:MAG: hypothetical protein IPJ28_14135 [Betaproteobacteria bacterium]|nr:hypothetical protein [Betaproteobacteria bacterium]
MSPEMSGKLLRELRAGTDHRARSALSPRERRSSGASRAGRSNKEIARALDIAETTVKIHVQHILAVWAIEHGIVPRP